MHLPTNEIGVAHDAELENTRLTDNFGRPITYLRLAVTDRCNLRCTYCMPPEGIQPCSHQEILTYDEITRLIYVCSQMGISKVRITGGEPFARKNVMHLIRQLAALPVSIYLTTNGVKTVSYLPQLKSCGIAGINLSLDTLRPTRFQRITRRNLFFSVWHTLETALRLHIPLKINTVVQRHVNEDEVIDIAKLAQRYPVDVRFIEEMKFNGRQCNGEICLFSGSDIFQRLQANFPHITPAAQKNATARYYTIPGFQGRIGIIAGESRCFCSECNRIRITARGTLKTCLYGPNMLNLRDMLRNGMSDYQLKAAVQLAVSRRYRNGFEAEQAHAGMEAPSMAAIGG